MIEQVFLLSLLVISFIIVLTESMKRAVVYLGLFSLVCSVLFLLYGAPDLAIAEVVVASGLSTILYLVAIKKAAHFTIFVVAEQADGSAPAVPRPIERMLGHIRPFLVGKGLICEVHIVESEISQILNDGKADLILYKLDDEIFVACGTSQACNLDAIESLLQKDPALCGCVRIDRAFGYTSAQGGSLWQKS